MVLQDETKNRLEKQSKVTGKVIATIPCYNTEKVITDIIARTRKYVDQVIVINDGSHDGTADAAKSAGALVVNHQRNGGYGEAIKSCIKAAVNNGADTIITIDGDGQHNPDEIPYLIAPIIKHEADIVIGSRFLNNGHCMPTYRKFGISVITWLWNFGAQTKVTDTQSGLRAYRREILESLSLDEPGMSVSVEILEQARRRKAKFMEVPTSCSYDHSTIHVKAVKHGVRVALSVLRIRFKHTQRALLRKGS